MENNTAHQADFENLVNLMLSLHQRRLKELPTEIALNLSNIDFLREFCTVRIDLGRQFGKTSYIQKNARVGDLVVVWNDTCRKHTPFRKDVTCITSNMPLPLGNRYKTIWIDEWMSIKQKENFYYWMEKLDPERIVIFGNEP